MNANISQQDCQLKFERHCPRCNKIITYTNKNNCNNAEKRKSLCKSCGTSLYANKPNVREQRSIRMRGTNHPMYGKPSPLLGRHLSEETKEKISISKIGIPISNERRSKLIEYAKTHDNPMQGKTVYSIWVEKYGTVIAEQKMEAYKKKQSINSTGEKNPMYGKPSPKGAGQGWKGYYRTNFFRSLRELSYMIHLDENNIIWETGEAKKFTISYSDKNGLQRTYRPDFFVDCKTLVEIKPQRLINTKSIQIKKHAAIEFCDKYGYKYEILDFTIAPYKIQKYLNSGDVVFIGDYKERFMKWITQNL